MKVLSVVGARPQFIKASVVSRALRRCEGIVEVLVHTGQHYDSNMSDIFFSELGLPEPDLHLGVGSGAHGAQTAAMIARIEGAAQKVSPDLVLTYGDTNSTLAAAIVAAKLPVPQAHVEAGLRSYNRAMPEETNRIVADRLSDMLFAPTQAAVDNLRREGTPEASIFFVGDVMLDVTIMFGDLAAQRSRILEKLRLSPRDYMLATVHRAENTDNPDRLNAIMTAFAQLVREIPIVLPLHPRTRSRWAHQAVSGLHLIEPVGYLDMLQLEKNARLIATDSGGVQKEAFFHRVPCATLRTETEWVELIETGWNRLVPPTAANEVYRGLRQLVRQPSAGSEVSLYGDGTAAARIADTIRARFAA